jgi:16S rRNA (guanine527-N7)-methyltransferase
MSVPDFPDQLARRASLAGMTLSAALAAQLEAYCRLLAHWNGRINLTALPLDPMTDQAIDRLLIEPLAAARHLSTDAPVWFDLGSGGGSPAIPMKLARPAGLLTMVESKERKAAFLREAVRVLHLDNTSVEGQRIEALAADNALEGTVDLITIRAVRLDPILFGAIRALLRFRGQVLLFGVKRTDRPVPRGFEAVDTHSASGCGDSALLVLERRT